MQKQNSENKIHIKCTEYSKFPIPSIVKTDLLSSLNIFSPLKNDKGSLIAQMITILAVAGIMATVSIKSFTDTIYYSRLLEVKSSVKHSQINLQAILQNDVSWWITFNHPDNSNQTYIECAKFQNLSTQGIDCRGAGGSDHQIKLFDASGDLYFDPTLEFSGFDFHGSTCNNSDPNVCPLKVNIYWVATNCPGVPATCYEPDIDVQVKFTLRQNKLSNNRAIHFNPQNYNFKITRKGGVI